MTTPTAAPGAPPPGAPAPDASKPVYTEEQHKQLIEDAVQKAVSGATATTQRELTAVQARVISLTQERDSAVTTSNGLKSENEHLKTIEGMLGDDVKKAGYWAGVESTAQARTTQLNADARTMTIGNLLGEFDGVSRAELEAQPTPYEMEIYALRNGTKKGVAAAPETKPGETPPGGTSPGGEKGALGPDGKPLELTPQPDRGPGSSPAGGGVPPGEHGIDKIARGLAERGDTPQVGP